MLAEELLAFAELPAAQELLAGAVLVSPALVLFAEAARVVLAATDTDKPTVIDIAAARIEAAGIAAVEVARTAAEAAHTEAVEVARTAADIAAGADTEVVEVAGMDRAVDNAAVVVAAAYIAVVFAVHTAQYICRCMV